VYAVVVGEACPKTDVKPLLPDVAVIGSSRRFIYHFRTFSEACRCLEEIRQRTLLVDPSNASNLESVQVLMDLSFFGKSCRLTGTALSTTEQGTVLRLNPPPLEIRRFMNELVSQEPSHDNYSNAVSHQDWNAEIPMGDGTDSAEGCAREDDSSSGHIVFEDEKSDDDLFGARTGLDWTVPLGLQEPCYRGRVASRSMSNLVQALAGKLKTGALGVDISDRMLVCILYEGWPMYFRVRSGRSRPVRRRRTGLVPTQRAHSRAQPLVGHRPSSKGRTGTIGHFALVRKLHATDT